MSLILVNTIIDTMYSLILLILKCKAVEIIDEMIRLLLHYCGMIYSTYCIAL